MIDVGKSQDGEFRDDDAWNARVKTKVITLGIPQRWGIPV